MRPGPIHLGDAHEDSGEKPNDWSSFNPNDPRQKQLALLSNQLPQAYEAWANRQRLGVVEPITPDVADITEEFLSNLGNPEYLMGLDDRKGPMVIVLSWDRLSQMQNPSAVGSGLKAFVGRDPANRRAIVQATAFDRFHAIEAGQYRGLDVAWGESVEWQKLSPSTTQA